MSLDTAAGEATVTQACQLFKISRAAYYEARKPSGTRHLRLVRPQEAQPAKGPQGPAEAPQSASEGSAPVPVAPSLGAAQGPAFRRACASSEALREAIAEVAKKHAAWGVRKVWATLRRPPYGLCAGRKRIWALMKDMDLTLPADRPERAEEPRGHVAVEMPNRRWATDMTTVWTRLDGLVAVMPVIDCGCRSILALDVSRSQESAALLAPVRQALVQQLASPQGVPWNLELRSDHGPQYTGRDCQDLCDHWRLNHTFAPVGRPTGNAVAERVIRTMKEECIWLRDWDSLEELRAALDAWRASYNSERPHQAIDWQTPAERRAERLSPDYKAAA